MSIGENIAKYRKTKGLTQEQLGELLGVTNQAVSKWESGVSMPDVMLLPKIANVLGITLEALYGMQPTEKRIKADDFPKAANDHLIEFFREHAKTSFHTPSLEEPWALVCLSNAEGGIFVSKNFSILDSRFRSNEEAAVFSSMEVLSAIKKLSNRNTIKVLAYMYRDSFGKCELNNLSYTIQNVIDYCGLSEDDAIDAIESLYSLHMLEIYEENHNVEYIFLKFRAFLALSVFKTTELLLKETFCYEVLRDTAQINDYAFEKLWKNKS